MNPQGPPGQLTAWPPVSVVMPVRDEESHLAEAVGQVIDQDYPGVLQVVLAVGASSDRTEQIAAELARHDPRVVIVANPTGRTPAALNIGIRRASYDIIARVDGHGELAPGYLTTAVRLLTETGADNVGGVMAARGRTAFEQAVAWAYTSRLGLGASRFHQGGTPGPAETVYLGVFRRAGLERVGGFDETMHRAQDWELNYRLRATGGLVWFSPELSVTYRPRSSLAGVARQFFRTGQWRREVIRRYPETASHRYLAPPVAVTAMILGTAAGLAGALGGPRWLRTGWLAPGGYTAALLAATTSEARDLPPTARAWLPAVCATMHTCWGLGFLVGVRPADEELASARHRGPVPDAAPFLSASRAGSR